MPLKDTTSPSRPNVAALPPWLWPRAAYVHVPFCAHHCGYCDFAIATGQDHLIELYLDALAAELSGLGEPQPVQTLFLGGGTPTHLRAAQLERLLSTILRWLPLDNPSRDRKGAVEAMPLPYGRGSNYADESEFSIECNPDSLTADKIAVLADHGVNRVSLGAQSFHADLLAELERAHNPDEIARAVERVRRRIDNVSLDLIFGVPGQTECLWRTDLARALSLEPDHLSTYGLTYEKGTPLWKRRQRGQLRALGEDAELTLYALAIDTLEEAGLEHYEISNFARPGRRCRHNQTYWANEAYFGFGMGAARYVLGRRELNTRDLMRYIRQTLSGESATWQSEELPPLERARETMAVQLRRAEGVDRPAFHTQTSFDLDAVVGEALARHVDQGFLADDGRSVRLTRRGKYVAANQRGCSVMISVVVPLFNESDSLPALYAEIADVARAAQLDLEMIFVDDGSTDGSWPIIADLAREHAEVHGIRFRRNFGKAAALSAGFRTARGDIIFTLDADLQDDPAQIPHFLALLSETKSGQRLDVISGWKRVRRDPWHKVWPSRIFNHMVSWLTGVSLHDHNCGMKCYRAEVFREVRLYGELHRFIPVLAAARGFRVGEIEINHRPRRFGHSKYGVRRFVKGFLDLLTVKFLTGFGQRPQHLLGSLGLVSFLLGNLGLLYLAVTWIVRLWHPEKYEPLHQRPLLIYALAALLLGAQMMSIGFLAELVTAYMSRDEDSYSVADKTPPKNP